MLGTIAGAQILVSGARATAEYWGLSEGLNGFTLVALGTSLPEIVTGLQARRGEAALAIGNVLGSNIFNSLAVGGVVAFLSPGPISAGLTSASWVVVGVGAVVCALMWSGRRLVRWEAVVLLGIYVATLPLVG